MPWHSNGPSRFEKKRGTYPVRGLCIPLGVAQYRPASNQEQRLQSTRATRRPPRIGIRRMLAGDAFFTPYSMEARSA